MIQRPPPRPGPSRRIAFYSHDTQGLGHVRRNITLAGALVRSCPDVDVLLLTGNPEATTLPLPPRTEVVTLPTIAKGLGGGYTSRVLSGPLDRVAAMRSKIIDGALDAFDPDLLVVDKVADGVKGELLPALRRLRRRGRTRTVLGLRDILDNPAVVDREWRAGRTADVIRELYDEVWVYGDPAVVDLVRQHPAMRSIAHLTRFTGYLAADRTAGLQPRLRTRERVRPPASPYVLCLVGGGQDGLEIATTFAATELPAGHLGVLVTGPYLPARSRDALRAVTADRPDLVLLEFIPDTDEFIAGAAAVVSMAGYNTACELLDAGRPTLLVPRTAPRVEQLLRARRFAELGLADMTDPADLSPQLLSMWLAGATGRGDRPKAHPAVDVAGLARVPALADALLQEAHRVA